MIHCVSAPVDDLPLHGVAATRRIEQRALGAVPAHALMALAGAAVARLARAIAPHARRVRIMAGPGNNGGDGLIAAIHLHRAGLQVDVQHVGVAPQSPADAQDALRRAQACGIAINPPGLGLLAPDDLCIDALLGIGATRAPQGALAEAIAAINALPCAVLAVDVPSGLAADTGQPLGSACVRARHTLTLLTAKAGLFTAGGRDHAGTVWLDTLGVDVQAEPPDAWLAGSAAQWPRAREHAAHKGSFGDVAIVGGAAGMVGAALLAGRAASAAGAGRVFVALLDAAAARLDPLCPELMLRPGFGNSAEQVLAQTTLVAGCGGGDAVRSVLPHLLAHAARLVLDADALNAIAADADLRAALAARRHLGLGTILTPHPLEAARLLGTSTVAVQADRLGAATRLAELFGCVVVLKGSGSVVASPGLRPTINPSGSAALASAGTGDVLAGWLGGLWAQRAESDTLERARRAAIAAVWQHGAAADASGRQVLPASELVRALGLMQAR